MHRSRRCSGAARPSGSGSSGCHLDGGVSSGNRNHDRRRGRDRDDGLNHCQWRDYIDDGHARDRCCDRTAQELNDQQQVADGS